MATELATLTAIGPDRNPIQEQRYQELTKTGSVGHPGGVESATGTYLGGAGYGTFAGVPSVEEYVRKQFATEDVALKELVMAMKAREAPLDVYTRLEEAAGLPEYRTTATSLMKEIANLEDYLLQIEPDITARTRESLVTEAQRRGMVAAGREEPLEKLGTLGTALARVGERMGIAERGIATKVELGLKGQEMALEPLKLYYTTLVDRNARLQSGFSEDRQLQLDVLWDKLQRERSLSDREWDLANEIASEERQYTRTLQTSAAQYGVSLTGTETSDEILGIIGTAAAEAIGWERGMEERKLAKTGAAATTAAAKESARRNLLDDAARGASLSQLQAKYGDKLSTSDIVELYTGVGFYGAPLEPYAREILGLEGGGGADKSTVQYWLDKGYSYDDAVVMASLY